jgi:hypothetical protein
LYRFRRINVSAKLMGNIIKVASNASGLHRCRGSKHRFRIFKA